MENNLGTYSTRPGSSTTNRTTATSHTSVNDKSSPSPSLASCFASGISTHPALPGKNLSTAPIRSDTNSASKTVSTSTPMPASNVQQSTISPITSIPESVSTFTTSSSLLSSHISSSTHHSSSNANLAASGSPLANAASGTTKMKFPFSVIYQAPFMDTVAILVLFMQFPLLAIIAIHLLFIASFFSGANNHNNNLISPLGFFRNPVLSLFQQNNGVSQNQYSSPASHSSGNDFPSNSSSASLNGLNPQGIPSGSNQNNNINNGVTANNDYVNIGGAFIKYNYIIQRILRVFGLGDSSVLSILKIITADIVAAMCTIYLMPHSKNLIFVFSCAIIASSLGGGSSPFTNAIYSTTAVEITRIIWSQINRALFSSTVIDHLHDHSHVYGDYLTIEASSVYSAAPYAGGSYNTLISAWALLPRFFRFAQRLNWIHEMPVILCQVVAVHVIGLGLLPFLKKIFSDNTNKPAERHFKPTNGSNPSSLTANFQSGPLSNYNNYYNGYGNNNGNSNGSSSYSASESPNDHHVTTITVHDDIASGNRNFEIDSHMKPYKDFEIFYVSPSAKKNKRLTQVRTNQPLWSTLASSIVLAARQESSTGLNADEEMAITSGIGVCSVRFIFENLIVLELNKYESSGNYEISVRVNGIQWPQVSIREDNTQNTSLSFSSIPESTTDGSDEHPLLPPTASTDTSKSKNPILIIVYGLTPMTQYDFEVSCAKDPSLDEFLTLIKASITTSARSSPSLSSSTASSSNAFSNSAGNPLSLRDIQPPTRPVSPVTTLLNTLTSAQMTLSDEKQKFKRVKKDHTKRLTALRGEIDSLKSKMGGNDKGDERNRRKVLGLRKEVEQNKEIIDSLSKELEHLINLETEITSEHFKLKKEWEVQISELNDKESKFREQTDKNAEKVNAVESEVFALTSKRDKLLAKKERLKSELDRVSTESQQIWDLEIQKQIINRDKRLEKRKKVEDELSSAMEQLKKGADNARRNASNVWVSIQMHQGGSLPHISNPVNNFSASLAPTKDGTMPSTLKSSFLGH